MSKVISHLRNHRRRAAFSQEVVAHLIGSPRGNDVTHYDRSLHEPTVRAAMAIEVVFRSPLKELFPDIYDKVEANVVKRARKMLRQFQVENASHDKLRSLMAIVEPPLDDFRFEPIVKP